MHEGERSLAISLNANAVNHSLQSIYSAIHGEITIHLQGDGRALAIDWNGHYNAQLQLDQPLNAGLTCIANAQTGSITILGASSSSSTIYRILVKQEQQSEDGHDHQHYIYSQELSSNHSNRRLVASHGLSSGTGDEGGASASHSNGNVAAAPALILAYADGSLVKIEWSEPEGQFFESELVREQSILSSVRSFWPARKRITNGSLHGTTPPRSPANPTGQQSSSPDQIIALASSAYSAPDTLFTVSRDRKLRLWSTATNTCIETIQLPSTSQTMDIVPISPTGEALDMQQQQQQQTSIASLLPSLLPAHPRPLLRLFSLTNSRQEGYMLAYIPTSHVQTSFFILYALVYDANGNLQTLSPLLEKPCDFALEAQSSCQLCDFGYAVSTSTLWTVWIENGQAVVRYSSLNAQQDSSRVLALRQTSPDPDTTISEITGPWYPVLPSLVQQALPLENPASLFDRTLNQLHSALQDQLAEHDSRPSAVEAAHQLTTLTRQAAVSSFLQHLFYPGRYPTSSIQNALHRYLQNPKSARIPDRRDGSLAQQVLDAVAVTLQIQQDPQTGALLEKEYVKQVRLEWLRFLALAEEGRREAVLPLGLHITVDGEVIILLRSGVGMASRTDSVARLVHLIDAEQEDLDVSVLVADQAVSEDVEAVVQACGILYRSMDADHLSAFSETISKAATSPMEVSLMDLATGIYDELLESQVDDDLVSSLISKLAMVQSQQRLLPTLTGIFLRLLKPVQEGSNEMEEEEKQIENSHHLAGGAFLAVDLAASSIVARHNLCVQAFMLLVFVAGEMLHPDPASWPEGVAEAPVDEANVVETVHQALGCLRTLSVAKWLAEHNASMTDIDAGLGSEDDTTGADSIMKRLSGLQMRQSMSTKPTGASQPRSVLQILADSEAFCPQKPGRLSERTSSFLADLGILVDGTPLDEEHAAILAAALQSEGRLSEALLLIDMLPEKNEDAALLHIKATIAADRGDIALAERCFSRVAAAIYAEDASLASLKRLIPPTSCDNLSSYYRLVVSTLDGRDADVSVARYCKLAIEAFAVEGDAEEQDPPTWVKDLWAKQFRCLATVGDFDSAYGCMMAIPMLALRRDCLRHLVAVMCDSGAVETLLRYGFIGMHAELEQTLSFRARNSHPLAVPDHYKILYAFHTSRSNYRSAAAIMYQKACRLAASSGEVAAPEAITAQCQSYLVASDALGLMAEDKQFIEIEVDAKKDVPRNRKRQRMLDAPVGDPAVVTLAMIRREYFLSLAKLQLSRDFPELSRSNKYLDPVNAVALFSQIGSFDAALQTALALQVDMTNVFEHIAIRCVHLSNNRISQGPTETWLMRDENASRWDGTQASKAWRLLEQYLSRYDGSGEYRKRVLDAILDEDRRTRLPKWLVNWFMAAHPEYLIWKLVEYDLLEEAFVHAFQMVEASQAELQRSAGTKRAGLTHLPYNLLDQLLLVDLSEEVAARREGIQGQQKELRSRVEGQQRLVEQLW